MARTRRRKDEEEDDEDVDPVDDDQGQGDDAEDDEAAAGAEDGDGLEAGGEQAVQQEQQQEQVPQITHVSEEQADAILGLDLTPQACFDYAKLLLKHQKFEHSLKLFTKALPDILRKSETEHENRENGDLTEEEKEREKIATAVENLKSARKSTRRKGDELLTPVTLEQIKNYSPSVSLILMGRGRAHQLLGKHDKAVVDFNNSLKFSFSGGQAVQFEASQRCRVYLLRGTSQVELKRYDLALKDFDAAARLNPSDASIYAGKAKLYMVLQQFEPAVHNCTVALKRDPMNAGAYQYLGIIYAQLNQLKEAIIAFERSLAIQPTCETFILRGKAYTAMQDANRAVQDFTSAIEIDPTRSVAYGNRAALFAQAGRLDLAITDASKWIEGAEGEDALTAYQARGVWLAQLGRYQEAIVDFSSVLKLEPKHILARNSRAMAFSHIGMHHESIKDWLSLLKHQPDWPKASLNLATEYIAIGDATNAVQYFSQAIKQDPKNGTIYENRAAAFSQLGVHDRALMDLSFALKLDSRNSRLFQVRAYEFVLAEQFDKAISDINSAILLDPLNPSNYERRAAFFWKMKKPKFGRTDLLQARRLRRKLAHQAFLQSKKAKREESRRSSTSHNPEEGGHDNQEQNEEQGGEAMETNDEDVDMQEDSE
jgi:tetratricopeptide (TPR) repeat protein